MEPIFFVLTTQVHNKKNTNLIIILPHLNSRPLHTLEVTLLYQKYVKNWTKVVKWHCFNEAESSLNPRTHLLKLLWALKF